MVDKEQMIIDALLIMKSVSFLEALVNKKILEIEALEEDYSDKANCLERELEHLLFKVNNEERNIQAFLKKYKEYTNEEKTLLSNLSSKKSILIRSISKNTRRKTGSDKVES